MRNTKAGFTLFECCIVLALIALTVMFIIPYVSQWVRVHRLTSTTNDLTFFLERARQLALANRETIIVCPTKDAVHCDSHWYEQWMLFKSTHQQTQVEQAKDLMQIQTAPAKTVSVNYHGFLSDSYIPFSAVGSCASNGRFKLEVQDGNTILSREIVISRNGRVRVVS